MKKLFNRLEYLITLIILGIYYYTMAPGLDKIDSGELAAVQYFAGIAHPTGYPLFTIIGHLFLMIRLPMRIISQLNLLSVIYVVSGIFFFIKTSKLIIRNYLNEQSLSNYSAANFIIILITVSFAFSKTIWEQSTSTEVYSLHIFFLSIIFFLLYKFFFNSQNKIFKYKWSTLFFLLGLSFANHLTTVLLIPAIMYLFFRKNKFNINSIKKFAFFALITFGVSGILYTYLPIRAAANPIMNWGNPINFENFFRHITGRQYQVWMFSSFSVAKENFINFLKGLSDEFSIAILILFIIGIFSPIQNKKEKTFLIICFFSSLLYGINYDIIDIQTYFILAYFSIILLALNGFIFVYSKFTKSHQLQILLILSVLFSIAYQIYSTFEKVNKNSLWLYDDYAKAVINSTELNSVILSYQWDYFISQSYYLQLVENYRKDVLIIDKELLRRSWYYNQIQSRDKTILRKAQNDVNTFLSELKLFERNDNFNPQNLEYFYRRIIAKIIQTATESSNCYLGIELVENEIKNNEINLPDGFEVVPCQFLFRIVKSNKYYPCSFMDYKIDFPKKFDKYVEFIRFSLAKMIIYRMYYEINYNHILEAKILYKKFNRDFPEFQLPNRIKSLLSIQN